MCAALLSVVEDVDRYRFIEPGPFQSGALTVTGEDIIANLPYRAGCAMWFDHHISNKIDQDFRGSFWVAQSAARVVFEYYSNGDLEPFGELVRYTDRIDAAALSMDEVRHPQGYVLVSMTVEGKRLDDEPYWLRLIDLLRQNDFKKLMSEPEVDRRCNAYYQNNLAYGQAINEHSAMHGNVLVTDFRKVWHSQPGNRFLAYTLFPKSTIWVRVMDHPNDPTLDLVSVAHNIFRRTSKVNIGELLAGYDGGGHVGAGSCRPLKADTDRVVSEIVGACTK